MASALLAVAGCGGDGTNAATILDVKSNEMGVDDEALAFAKFFDNGYDRAILVPEGGQL